MLNNVNPRDDRLYGMMQALMAGAAQNNHQPTPEPRGIVTEQDAADAVLSLSAFLDAHVQSGAVGQEEGAHMAAMLMTIRDYVRPLPVGTVDRNDGQGEHDGVTEDLRDVVKALRAVSAQEGIRG